MNAANATGLQKTQKFSVTSMPVRLNRDLIVTFPCRHGIFSVFRFDNTIGRGMQTYGEWAESEIELLLRFVPEDGVVVDAGANIGTHSLAMSSHTMRSGRVLAFEPQPQVFQLLRENVHQNSASNISIFNSALSDTASSLFMPVLDVERDGNFGGSCPQTMADENDDVVSVRAVTLDSLNLTRCDLIKCDVEGMEAAVLRGSVSTIERCRPVVYAECLSLENGLAIQDLLKRAGYVLWAHHAPAFNPRNCFGNHERIFGLARECNILAAPSERVSEWSAFLEKEPTLKPAKDLDELARALLDIPRWGDPDLAQLSRSGLIARITRLLEDKTFLENRVRDIEGRLSESRRLHAFAESQVAPLRQQVSQLVHTVDDLERQRNLAVESERTMAGIVSQQTTAMEREQDSAQAAIASLHGKLTEQATCVLAAQKERDSAHADRAALQVELAEQSARAMVAQKELDAAQVEIASGLIKLAEQTDCVLAARKDTEAAQVEIERLQAKLTEQTEAVLALSVARDAALNVSEGLQEAIAEHSTMLDEAREAQRSAEADIIVLSQRLAEAEDTASAERSEKARAEAQIRRLNQALIDQQNTVDALYVQLEGDRSKLTRRIGEYEEVISGRDTALKNHEARLQEMENLYSQIQQQLTEMDLITQDREKQVRELRESLSWRCTAPLRTVARVFTGRQPSAPPTDLPAQDEPAPASIAAVAPVDPAEEAARLLFDEDFYLGSNPDVKDAGVNAFDHFMNMGGWEDRDPNPLFDTSWYLTKNPDVAESGQHPLSHYVRSGWSEGRDPHPLFDSSFYLDQNPDVRNAGVNPLLHFIRQGWRENRNPHPLFSTAFYKEQKPQIDSNPLVDFMSTGFRDGLDPHPLFDSSFYLLSNQGALKASGIDGLSHYLLNGAADQLADPHPFFNTSYYVQSYPEVATADINPLVHFVLHGRERGLLSKPVFNLVEHHRVLTELDKLRTDGCPVILAISHIGGGGTEKHIRDLKQFLGNRCHLFLLSPSNHCLLGNAVKSFLTLAPIGEACESVLFFDTKSGLDDLVGVLLGIGVARIHIHHILGHENWIEPLVRALKAPFDVTIHDYYLLAPQPQLAGEDGRYAGPPDEHQSELLTRGTAVASLEEWRSRHAWLLLEAERVIAPTVEAAEHIRRYYPAISLIAASHPSAAPILSRDVLAVRPADGEPLRILILGELSKHKGRQVVEKCAEHAKKTALPLSFHLLGFADAPVREESGLIQHGRYKDEFLLPKIRAVAPHVIWFPALWPETYVYTLSAALLSKTPIVATDIGAFPERLGGRSWTWLAPIDYTAEQWCTLFNDVRHGLLHRKPPLPPPVRPVAAEGFYDTEYVVR